MKVRSFFIAAAMAAICGCGAGDEVVNNGVSGSNNATTSASNNGTTTGSNNGTTGTNNATTSGPPPMWERIDTNFGLTDPYATYRVASDAQNLYALAVVQDDDPSGTWTVLRSEDDGDTWSSVHRVSSGRAVNASFFGDLDGRFVLVVPAFGEAAIFVSDDRGETWNELTRLPKSLNKAVAHAGDRWLVAGAFSFRSVDGGTTWEPIDGTPEVARMNKVVRFADAFWGLDGVGSLHRLIDDATAWQRVPGGPSATDMWVDEGKLWVKLSYDALATSDDGTTWTELPTAEADEYGQVYQAPDDGTPWFLADEAPAKLLVSADGGASASDITVNFPRDANDLLCMSQYTATGKYAVAATRGAAFDASGCTPGEDAGAGVYRLAFED